MIYIRIKGFSLLEATLGLMVASIGLSVLWTLAIGVQQSSLERAAAQQVAVVTRAAQSYINIYNARVLALVPNPDDVVEIRMIDGTSTGEATLPSLVESGLLPAGYRNVFAYGGGFKFFVRHDNLGTYTHLTGLVVTDGTETLSDKQGYTLAGKIGPAGGFVYGDDTTMIKGNYGGWQVTLADFGIADGAGRIASLTRFADEGAGAAGGGGSEDIDSLDDGISDPFNSVVHIGENSGSSDSGSSNTTLGYQVMMDPFQLSFSVAMGAYALGNDMLNSSYITAVGRQSLGNSSSTNEATALGSYSGNNVGVNALSVILGHEARSAGNPPSGSLIALGHRSFLNNTGGNGIAIGWEAGDNTTGANNIIIGRQALGQPATMDDTYRMAIGDQAEYRKNGAGAAASYQVSIGPRANYGGTHPASVNTQNIAIGFEANYSGMQQVIAIGHQALKAQTSSLSFTPNYRSIGIGFQAGSTFGRGPNYSIGALAGRAAGDTSLSIGYNTNPGNDNMFVIGAKAMRNPTAGHSNYTIIGAEAGETIGSGTRRLAIGYRAMRNQARSNNSLAIGAEALYGGGGSDRDYALAIGDSALYSAAGSTAFGGYAIGHHAMRSHTGGGQNVVIGAFAGEYTQAGPPAMTPNLTGQNNILIGARLSTPLSNTSNMLMIGTAIRADNTQGSSSRHVVIGGVGNEAVLGAGSAELYVVGTMEALNYLYSSDRRLKTDIQPINNTVAQILKLKPVSFNWKKDGKKAVGFIAQDVQDVFTEVVASANDTWAVDYCSLIAPAMAAAQEQAQQMAALHARQVKLQQRQNRLLRQAAAQAAATGSAADVQFLRQLADTLERAQP
jgi:type II secretory pathway pseudopilin PulG